MVERSVAEAISALPCWSGTINISPLAGGLTNHNYVVSDGRSKFVVRHGSDNPMHGIMRFNEVAAAKAACAAGIGPEVIYTGSGFMVSQFVEGRTLTAQQMLDPLMLERVCSVLRRCHNDMPKYWQGAALIFWVFQVIRGYIAQLESAGRSAPGDDLEGLRSVAARLEAAVGPVVMAFGHNDLLAANFIDDGARLWLIDWDYAGFNSPLFDLANFSSNNGLVRESDRALLATYFERAASADEYRGFRAMVCASLLRETLWARVSALSSKIEFDYGKYANDYRSRFEHERQGFEKANG